jgi:enoyl-CoA hydratase/carnithine racemase
MVMPRLLEVSRQDRTLRLSLNNPPANALSICVLETIQTELDAVRHDEAVRVVVISAEGGGLFSAGHDLKEMTAHRADPDGGRSFFEHTFALCSQVMRSIVELPQPVIAEVDGIATAAGCQLVASCDLAYASDAARFAVNGINLGLFCSTPAVALTRNVPIKRAMEMLLTGKIIDSGTALDIGLINGVAPKGALRGAVNEVASVIAGKSPMAIRLGKRAVREQASMSLADAYDCASLVIVENMLADDAAEGIRAFLDKRESTRRGG